MREDLPIQILRRDLENTCKGYSDAIKEKNLDLISGYYTKDCNLLIQGGVKVTGRDCVEKEFETEIKNIVDHQIQLKEIYKITNDTVIGIGERLTIYEIDGIKKEKSMKYVVQWERQSNGLWQAKLDIGLKEET